MIKKILNKAYKKHEEDERKKKQEEEELKKYQHSSKFISMVG